MKRFNVLNILLSFSMVYELISVFQKLSVLFSNESKNQLMESILTSKEEMFKGLENIPEGPSYFEGIELMYSAWIANIHQITVFEFIAYAVSFIGVLMMYRRTFEGWYVYIAAQLFLASIPFIFIGAGIISYASGMSTVLGAILMAVLFKIFYNKEVNNNN